MEQPIFIFHARHILIRYVDINLQLNNKFLTSREMKRKPMYYSG